jgi:hypothetical protein
MRSIKRKPKSVSTHIKPTHEHGGKHSKPNTYTGGTRRVRKPMRLASEAQICPMSYSAKRWKSTAQASQKCTSGCRQLFKESSSQLFFFLEMLPHLRSTDFSGVILRQSRSPRAPKSKVGERPRYSNAESCGRSRHPCVLVS